MKGQRGRAGWSKEETALLFERTERAHKESLPLRSAFEAVAKQTGRQPNSVRNYYYAQMRARDMAPQGAFTPFTQAESERLMEAVLTGQARGMSVRSVTMQLAAGDKKRMLRYQNKYRSLIKTDPEGVLQVYERLKASGKPAFHPYCQPRPHKSGRKPNAMRAEDMDALLQRMGEGLRRCRGVDADRLLGQLTALVELAAAPQQKKQV